MKIKILLLAIFSVFISFGQSTLPLTRTAWGVAPAGWTDNGINRTTSFACSGNNGGSLQATGKSYKVQFTSTPNVLTYSLKGSNPSTGDFRVQESIDGTIWIDVATYTTVAGTSCSNETKNLLSTSRYVQFLLVNRSSGNIDIDDVGITSGAGSPPVVTASNQTGVVGSSFSYNVFATNIPTNYNVLSGSLPAGLILNATTGLISGTPTTSGSYTADITATNGSGTSASAAINFTISAATSTCVTQGFGAGTVAPSGWQFTGISGTYTIASNYGLASPSLSFDTTNDIITTEVLATGNAASQLSFWIKGQGINSGSKSTFQIDGFDGTSWTNIDILSSATLIASSSAAIIKTYNSGSTPALAAGFLRFRFTYKKGTGNLAFDDVTVSCVPATVNVPVVISTTESVTVAGAFSAYVNASNFPTSYAIVGGTLPAGLSFNTTTGQITGAATTAGTYSINVTATNLTGVSNVGTIDFTVSNYVAGCYVVNFEDGTTKSSYASDNILLNGKLWNLSECVSGGTNTVSDFGSGNYCLRMRSNANASATLIQDKSYGLATIEFDYKKFTSGTYTNQSFNVEYSIDSGNTWIFVGNISPSTTATQIFNATINQAGPVRVRIIFASGTEDDTVRLNIDNLKICDYTINREIEVFGNATTIFNNSITVSESNNTNFSPSFFVGLDLPIIKTYTISNYGLNTLNLSGLSITVSPDFSITAGLSSSVLTAGQSATFSITFNSLTTGLKTATVTINSDDADEGIYNFLISAKALNYTKCTLLAPSILAQQDFDSNVGYLFTQNTSNSNTSIAGGTNYGANRTSPVNMFSGSKSFQSKTNLNKVTFASQNTQNYQNIELSFNVGAFGTTTTAGMNTADYLLVSISIDGGIKYYPQIKISGNNNSVFDINNTLSINSAKFKTNSTVGTAFGCTNNSTNTVSGRYKITNLPNVTDLRVQVTFLSSASSKIWALDNVILKGQLPLTSTWDGSNWLPTIPNTATKAIIGVDYTTTVLNGSIDSCECQISSGAIVNIEPSYYLDCESDFKNDGILNVKNNASLVQVNDEAFNSGTANNIFRTTSTYEKYDYIYWSSPLFNTTIGAQFSTWRLDYAFWFKTQNFEDLFSGLGFPQTTGAPDSFDDTGDDWQKVTAASPMIRGLGYTIMAPTNVSFATSPTASVVFSGTVNNGEVIVPIEESFNATVTNDDFNLIGNPYPSAISADAFIKANILPLATANKFTGSLYFWTHKGDIQPVTTNPGPLANNFNANDYAAYNLTGSTATGSGAMSGSGGAAPLGYIASGQAFFIESSMTGSSSVVFNNSMRNKTYNNSQFYRSANNNSSNNSTQTNVEKDRIWLNLENTDHMFSQQLIGYPQESTLEFDYGYDAEVSQSQNYVSFYSFMDNSPYLFRIQGRSAFDFNDQVPFGYSSAVSGTTNISIDRAEGILNDPSTNVYLQDNLLNITHDLKQSPYTFVTNYGTFDDRFVLKYIDSNLSNNAFANDENLVKIAINDYKINIFSGQENMQSVEVFDILGRRLFNKDSINNKSMTIDTINDKNQTLIVKVKLADGVVFTKKVVL